MGYEDVKLLPYWVDNYYREVVRVSNLNGVKFSYYKSLRGYYKHSILLNEIIDDEFNYSDFRIWNRILMKIKSGHNSAESGGLFFRYQDYKDICKERTWKKTRKKLLQLELLVETPFEDYLVLNPKFIIKMYNPKIKDHKK